MKLPSSIVITLREILNRSAHFAFNLAAKLAVDVLDRACTDHEQKTGPLDTAGAVFGVVIPPASILFAKIGWVNDVVVEVYYVEKTLDQGICGASDEAGEGD